MRCLFIIFLLLLPLPQWAFAERYEVAAWNYEQGNYDIAMEQFMNLASFGNKDAQYSVGAMYIKGLGVEKNYIEGYGWLKVASSKGYKAASDVVAKIGKALDDKQLQRAEQRYEALLLKYGDEVIERNFLPKLKKTSAGTYRSRKPIRKIAPEYPRNAVKMGRVGSVTVEYTVGRDGRTRFHRVKSYTEEVFVEGALEATKQFLYKPAMVNGAPVDVYAVRNRFTYQIAGDVRQRPVVKTLKELKEKAERGSSVDRYKYAVTSQLTYSFLNDKYKNKFDDYSYWNMKAAVDGHPLAKFELGANILYGEQCEADTSKSYFWLTSAAQDGVTNAQLLLGLERYYGVQFDKNEAEGLRWIKKAGDGGSDSANIQYAMLLALSSNADADTIKLAREHFDRIVFKKFVDKLSYYEINAALFSVEGKFDNAIIEQKKALEESVKYNLPDMLIRENLNRLESRLKIVKLS